MCRGCATWVISDKAQQATIATLQNVIVGLGLAKDHGWTRGGPFLPVEYYGYVRAVLWQDPVAPLPPPHAGPAQAPPPGLNGQLQDLQAAVGFSKGELDSHNKDLKAQFVAQLALQKAVVDDLKAQLDAQNTVVNNLEQQLRDQEIVCEGLKEEFEKLRCDWPSVEGSPR